MGRLVALRVSVFETAVMLERIRMRFMVGLAGFEPAISWAPDVPFRSQATRRIWTHRGDECPLDLASRQPLSPCRGKMSL